MPYFPNKSESAYKCQGCGGWFIPANVSCGVAHGAGSCCHYGEAPTSQPSAPLDALLAQVTDNNRHADAWAEASDETPLRKVVSALVEDAVDFALAACVDCGCSRMSHFVSDAVLECRCGDRPCGGEFRSIFGAPVVSPSSEPPIEPVKCAHAFCSNYMSPDEGDYCGRRDCGGTSPTDTNREK